MSSLWSLVQKGKTAYLEETFPDGSFFNLKDALQKTPPKLVNISAIADWVHQTYRDRSLPPLSNLDLTPGFVSLWLEWMKSYDDNTMGRVAVCIFRVPPGEVAKAARSKSLEEGIHPDAKHSLFLTSWAEINGQALLYGGGSIQVDQFGRPISGTSRFYGTEENQQSIDYDIVIATEALTVMNTRGTHIEPPLNATTVQVVKPNRAPCSVWHTIHLPRMPSLPLEGAESSDTILERREHWVRAHRKDYRSGAGLFGRTKALVWVHEFVRGNPELGTVKQSYEVHRRDAGRADDKERKALPPAKEA
jgi:hypothetical protein